MNLCRRMRLQLTLLTALHSLLPAQCIIYAAVNHSQVYNNNGSDVNLSKNEIIHRYNNDNNQYEINESEINLRDSLFASSSISSSISTSTSTSTIINAVPNNTNFLITDFLSDGEIERRISYNGVVAKETRISMNEKSYLRLWQLSYDDTFIQMIYSLDNDLLDCEYLKGRNFAAEFVQKFYDEIERAEHFHKFSLFAFTLPKLRHRIHRNVSKVDMTMNSDDEIFSMKNISYQPLNTMNDVPNDLAIILSYDNLKTQCDNNHRQMMQIIDDSQDKDQTKQTNATNHLNRRKRALSDWLIAPNTKWCGRGQTADKYSQLGGASKADKCCRRHDHCKFNIYAMTTKWRLFNYRPFTISHCSCDMRHRRDLTSFFRVPGTKWCGKGYSAKKYAELGGYSKADRCCRQHDKSCPFWIMGLETKYGYFNWRINTLMHCKCDDRFRTCLKMADSADATMVGKLFFNIVQTKCFVLKPERHCKVHSWWGGCEKEGVRKRAHLRNNKKF